MVVSTSPALASADSKARTMYHAFWKVRSFSDKKASLHPGITNATDETVLQHLFKIFTKVTEL